VLPQEINQTEPALFGRRVVGALAASGTAAGTLAAVAAIEKKFSKRVDACDSRQLAEEYDRCVSSAMDSFAKDLGQPKVNLSADLKNVPSIISKAASQVRLAHVPETQRKTPAPQKPGTEDSESRKRTLTLARTAVVAAAAQIRKELELIKAVEEEPGATVTRTGQIIAVGMERTADKLERAIGL
jgi:hypothetical protein